ncbi:zinc-finger homeodomain protein 6-like [Carica papaya]|uniref:zinc-finger homeodomain protein 6-like n=1 Tax=Carica papaya TaxID=3649 RepID=UPI000B8D005F|nr:zinc-finger homeodomain protein 6-like [Carica papaya]
MDLSVVPYTQHTSSDTDHDSPGDAIEVEHKPSAADSRSTDFKKSPPPVKFKECMRNHAASIGGHANDGCGEFMPRGLDGTRESLTCAACGCHRNFHRREIPGAHFVHHHPPPPSQMVVYNAGPTTPRWDKNVMNNNSTTTLPLFQPRNMSTRRYQYNRNNGDHHHHHHHHLMGAVDEGDHQDQDHEDNAEAYDRRSETPERGDGNVTPGGGTGRTAAMMMRSKRFRTKFTQEQKDRMLEFAERIGWRIQRNDDGVLNQFCNEVGVKRNVLKVWMHNNKNAHRRRELSLQSPMSGGAAADTPPAPPQQSHPPQPIGV